VPGAVNVTVNVPPPSGVPVPRQEFAVPSPGAEQTKKSWGIAPTLLTWNVTLPCLTVFVESVMANSVGVASSTVTLEPPVHFVKWKPAPGWARMMISTVAGRNVASQASFQASDPEP
jgi:hypothetical protein